MPPLFTCNADVERIGRGLLDCSLPKIEWNHAAHFAAAFWLLKVPRRDATRDMPTLIRAYNVATGVPNTDTGGYHETITLASLRAARAWLAERPKLALHEALSELLASPYGRSGWPLEYWSKSVLFSPAARRAWVDPNLQALPF
jgi:hypothetical protein